MKLRFGTFFPKCGQTLCSWCCMQLLLSWLLATFQWFLYYLHVSADVCNLINKTVTFSFVHIYSTEHIDLYSNTAVIFQNTYLPLMMAGETEGFGRYCFFGCFFLFFRDLYNLFKLKRNIFSLEHICNCVFGISLIYKGIFFVGV